MNLIEQFHTLLLPDGFNERELESALIIDHERFRIAVDHNGNPHILISVSNDGRNEISKNYRLRNLEVAHNISCTIYEEGKTKSESFTLIKFTNPDRHLQEFFLRLAESLINSLGNEPTREQVVTSITKLVEVLRSLSDVPTNTVQGLWAELHLISDSSDPSTLLNYWHINPDEKFDFNSGNERIEVKSSGNFERIHTFSSEQLNPPVGSKVLICSMFVRPNSNGLSIQSLIDNIANSLQDKSDLIDKMRSIVAQTLGSSLEQALRLKFDPQIARESISFFDHNDIKKIEELDIPIEVTEVRYRSNLSEIEPCKLHEISDKGKLFCAI